MSVDVAIVGLGTAGAAAAARCAARGLSVVGFEARSLDQAGASWVNGVPGWAFDASGVARPTGEECVVDAAAVHLVAGWGPERVVLRDHGMLEVDMRRLVHRLHRDAEAAGAELRGGVQVTGVDGRRLLTSDGEVRARWLVDASGLGGVRLLGQRHPRGVDLCHAAKQVRELDDPDSARVFFASLGAAPEDFLVFTGVSGGYSIVMIGLHGGQLSMLCGAIPALGFLPGAVLAERFASEHSWVGAPVETASAAIPLGGDYQLVGQGRIALIGDAARQVWAPNGSGVAQQLLAAELLADALADGTGPEGYDVAWQRRYGGPLAAAAVFRRWSQHLRLDQFRALVTHRAIHPDAALDTFVQRPSRPPPRAVLHSALGLARVPRLAPALVRDLARMRLLERHYRRYPANPRRRRGWRLRLRLLGG